MSDIYTARDKKIDVLVCIEFLMAVAIMILYVYQKTVLVSLLFYISFVIEFVILMMLNGHRNGNGSLLKSLYIIAGLVAFNVFFNLALNLGQAVISLNYFKKYIMFMSTLIYMYIGVSYKPTEGVKRLIEISSVLLVCFYVYAYRNLAADVYFFNGMVSQYLTFGMTNPNMTGLVLCIMIPFCAYFFYHRRNLIFKVLAVLLCVQMIVYIQGTQARNSLIAAVIFLGTAILLPKSWTARLPNWATRLIALYPFIFSLMYLASYTSTWFINAFSFLIDAGKPLTSRVEVWQEGYMHFLSSPIFGAYCEVSGGSGQSQLLNIGVDILVSYGVIPFILVCNYFTKILALVRNNVIDGSSKIAFLGVASVFISGAGEAAMVSGGSGISIFLLGLLLLGNESRIEGYYENSICE